MKPLTYLTIGFLVLGAVAMPAMAQEAEPTDRSEKADRIREACSETDNETLQERCKAAKDNAHDFQHARRAAHHLHHAIAAMEKRLERLETHQIRVEHMLESGNLTENETAELEVKLERIEAAQEKTEAKIAKLEAKLERLKAKYEQVREHVTDMREKRANHDRASDRAPDRASDNRPGA